MNHPHLTKSPRTLSKDGSLHVTDEICNTLISSVGALLSLAGTILLITFSVQAHKFWQILSFSIYGPTVIFVFLSSALHHGIDGSEKTEHLLRQLDYYAIFLAIAGTVTPFCLILFRNNRGWSLLGLVWSLALAGIVLKTFFHHLPKWVWVGIYIGMAWSSLVILYPLYRLMPTGLEMILAGGLFFMVGSAIYYLEKPNPFPGKFGFHEIWHLFVVAGMASNFSVMYFYLLPH